jgi:hypothetical protein
MPRPKSLRTIEIEKNALAYIETIEMFWLADLKEHLHINKDNWETSMISKFCIDLYRNGILEVAERRGNHVQYMKI